MPQLYTVRGRVGNLNNRRLFMSKKLNDKSEPTFPHNKSDDWKAEAKKSSLEGLAKLILETEERKKKAKEQNNT